MKKTYQNVEIELAILSAADVVSCSGEEFDDAQDDIFGPNS